MQRRHVMQAIGAMALSGGALGLRAQTPKPVTLHGAGATFPAKVYGVWGTTYAKRQGIDFQYDGVGSGKGIEAIRAGTVDFGASDAPLTPQQLDQWQLMQVPMVVGGLVPVAHAGVSANLAFNAEVLGDIYAGHINQWDAAPIQALNPGVNLPAKAIQRVVRADKSGSTQAFVTYLGTKNPLFKAADFNPQAPQWPAAVTTAEGSGGVVKQVAQTPWSIGYVGQDYLGHAGIKAVSLHTPFSNAIQPSRKSYQAALLASGFGKTDDDTVSLIATPSRLAWPITMTTFIILPRTLRNNASALAAARFVYWALNRGDDLASAETFAPLPLSLQMRMANRLSLLQTHDKSKIQFI